jgi:hypothetical protein
MRRLLLLRTVLALIGVAVWGWGYRTDDAQARLAGIIILAVTLLLRFVPKRWVETADERAARESKGE